MCLLIDEDTAVQLVEPLRHVLLGHEVAHIADLSWKGKKDLRVLPDARNAGYHVLITRARAQPSDAGDRDQSATRPDREHRVPAQGSESAACVGIREQRIGCGISMTGCCAQGSAVTALTPAGSRR